MKPIQLFTIFSVVLLTLPVVVFAQLELYRDWWNPQIFADVLKVPVDWLTTPSNFIYRLLIPFLVAFTVIYGLLEELGIFRRTYHTGKINIVLAFAMAFLLLPAGILTLIVNVFYATGAFIGLMGFGVLFIVGVFLWSRGTAWKIWGEYEHATDINRQIHRLQDEIDRMKRKAIKETRALRNEEENEISKKTTEIDELRKLRSQLRGTETK